MYNTLDVAISPMEEFIWTMGEGGWIIALTGLLVIGAVIGIIIFNKKRKKSEGEKK